MPLNDNCLNEGCVCIIQPFRFISIFANTLEFLETLKELIRKEHQPQNAFNKFSSIGMQRSLPSYKWRNKRIYRLNE